jgi:hypothetical protein
VIVLQHENWITARPVGCECDPYKGLTGQVTLSGFPYHYHNGQNCYVGIYQEAGYTNQGHPGYIIHAGTNK